MFLFYGVIIIKKTEEINARKIEAKPARNRLLVLLLAEALGNVSEACRLTGIDRTSFYQWKRRFIARGFDGLSDLPPVHKSHPQATHPEVVEKIIERSLSRPSWGCVKISDQLKLEGISVSSPTVQKILIKNGMGSKYSRLLKLEEKACKENYKLSDEQIRLIEKANPCFRERENETSSPGEILQQDTLCIGRQKKGGKVYLQLVVDTYSSFGFAFIHTGKLPECAVAILHKDILPKCREWGIKAGAVLTDNGREYCGKRPHAYELYLALNGIEHMRVDNAGKARNAGFLKRFQDTLMNEFIRGARGDSLHEPIEIIQNELDKWLYHYNYERPHKGYRNMGKRPIDTIMDYVQGVKVSKNEDWLFIERGFGEI